MEGPVMFQGVDKDSMAFKLMKQMGWEEGTGLGKEKQGIKQHLRVKKKNDNSGLGVDEKEKAARNWTFNTSTFDNILKNLKVRVAESESNQDQVEKPVVEPIAEAHDQQRKIKKVARPQGRYKKREGGKLVKGYSMTDLQAILGDSWTRNEQAVSEIPQPAESTVKPESDLSDLSNGNKAPHARLAKLEIGAKVKDEPRTGSRPIKQEFDPKRVKQEVGVGVKSENLRFGEHKLREEIKSEDVGGTLELRPVKQEALPSDWWGNKFGFVRAGQLGSQQPQSQDRSTSTDGEATSAAERNAFSEQDQENLYNLVQDKATTGKQGLGIADRPKKIGGARFEGQKTNFGSDDEEDEILEQQSAECTSASGTSVSNDSQAQASSKKRKSENDGDGCVKEQDVSTSGVADGLKIQDRKRGSGSDLDSGKQATKFRWKKLCKGILLEAPGQTMRLKSLEKLLMVAAGLPIDSEGSVFNLKDKIEKSSQFSIDGKKVSLVVSG